MDGDPPMYDNHSMDTVTLLGIKAGVATFVQGTVVQGDFGLRRLLSKEAFTSANLRTFRGVFELFFW